MTKKKLFCYSKYLITFVVEGVLCCVKYKKKHAFLEILMKAKLVFHILAWLKQKRDEGSSCCWIVLKLGVVPPMML